MRPPVLNDETYVKLINRIVSAEKDVFSWTLMHRFNLCHDLLDGIEDNVLALALLFVWLRYSAIRQLDWQRHFDTKPRELSFAQNRLTLRLASIYAAYPKSRFWIRLLLTTVGRGGEGQAIRDEILNIIHRYHIGEGHWHFLEQWHQKLHNNTTPDDIAICEAYIVFLESNGDLVRFYSTLANSGVTRDRLLSFDRPIKADPDFYADRKDGLLQDFRSFLCILKSVHSSNDLEAAITAAWDVADQQIRQKLNTILTQRQQGAATLERIDAITALRKELLKRFGSATDAQFIREMLYLDLALEQTLMIVIEQQNFSRFTEEDLLKLTWLTLDNLCISLETLELKEGTVGFKLVEELGYCACHLGALLNTPQDEQEAWLHARSVTDRISRAIGAWIDQVYDFLQPKAEQLGELLGVQRWAITMFSEEIIRGNLISVLSLLLHHLEPRLRERAGIGDWQIISPGRATGWVRVVEKLRAVQGGALSTTTLLVADIVCGDEEIPKEVTAIITRDTPDLVSHVAVRARNDHKLFATCFNKETYAHLKARENQQLALRSTLNGEVEYHVAASETQALLREPVALSIKPRKFSSWVVTPENFTVDNVGGKSNSLYALRDHIPGWLHLPPSIALPFGVFEESLIIPENCRVMEEYENLLPQVQSDPETVLPRIRQILLKLEAPEPLRQALLSTWQEQHLPTLEWAQIWQAVKQVWASKWNERAYYSRVTRRMRHEDVMMAVLVQQVVESNYAFVIHTINPLTGNNDEIIAEVVLGMGETLVGNYPGRALSFLCRKDDLSVTLLSYPSKSVGLYGSGVIFRSDSNDEDLQGFAGAGLYDSVLAKGARPALLDYSKERLVWNKDFRRNLLRRIAQVGIEVESACGSAQDIEGVVQRDIEGAVQENQFYIVQTRTQVGLAH